MPDGGHEDKGRRLRALASKPGVSYRLTKHAREEMAKDNISLLALRSMLKRCAVIMVEQSNFEETWRATGHDVDGNSITAIVVAYESIITIKVITAWKPRR